MYGGDISNLSNMIRSCFRTANGPILESELYTDISGIPENAPEFSESLARYNTSISSDPKIHMDDKEFHTQTSYYFYEEGKRPVDRPHIHLFSNTHFAFPAGGKGTDVGGSFHNDDGKVEENIHGLNNMIIEARKPGYSKRWLQLFYCFLDKYKKHIGMSDHVEIDTGDALNTEIRTDIERVRNEIKALFTDAKPRLCESTISVLGERQHPAPPVLLSIQSQFKKLKLEIERATDSTEKLKLFSTWCSHPDKYHELDEVAIDRIIRDCKSRDFRLAMSANRSQKPSRADLDAQAAATIGDELSESVSKVTIAPLSQFALQSITVGEAPTSISKPVSLSSGHTQSAVKVLTSGEKNAFAKNKYDDDIKTYYTALRTFVRKGNSPNYVDSLNNATMYNLFGRSFELSRHGLKRPDPPKGGGTRKYRKRNTRNRRFKSRRNTRRR
jgi:hypothetical protein